MRLSLVSLSVVAAFAVVVMAGCPGPEYPKCESDAQCKKNKDGAAIEEYCLLGQCQECAKDTHCDAGERCNRGRCEQTCASDDQCGEGNICEANKCQKAQCASDDACGSGASCQQGRCKRAGAAGVVDRTNPRPEDLTGLCATKSRVNFDFNMSDLRPEARTALDSFAKCMRSNAGWRLTIEGHADDRGTSEFNISLGDSRAKSARKYLSALGVDENRMKVVSYGEEKPLDPGQTEDAWAKNRRAELIVNQ